MKIIIDEKYLRINSKKGEELAYFEHFKGKGDRKEVVQITAEDKKGNKFLKENNGVISDCDVCWFGVTKKYKVLFVFENYFSYIVLIKPKLLRII
jgi:hypothetical protein